TSVCNEGLKPYQDEIRAVEEMYRSIWQLHGYLDMSQIDKKLLVANAFEHEVRFPNDALLIPELESYGLDSPYDLLARDLREEVAPIDLPRVIARLDAAISGFQRFGKKDSRELVRRVINEIWTEFHSPPSDLAHTI